MATRKKKPTKPKKAVRRKPAATKKAAKKAPARRRITRKKRIVRGKRTQTSQLALRSRGRGAASSGQSGGLQGLSGNASADSESVEELLEEGNTLEAAAVAGVEDADSADEGEVVTHEVPEDDVPEEYLDDK